MNRDLEFIPLRGTFRRIASGTRLVGECDPGETVTIDIHIRRPPGVRTPPSMDYWMKHPPGDRTFLTRADFAAELSADTNDVDGVTSFCKRYGLTIVRVRKSERVITADGTVEQMKAALHVDLRNYRSRGQQFRSRQGYIKVLKSLEPVIISIAGLDTKPQIRSRGINGQSQSLDLAPRSGRPGWAISPMDVVKRYKFPTKNRGTGQTIGILELAGGYVTNPKSGRPSDIDLFTQLHKLPKTNVCSVTAGGHNRPAGRKYHVQPGDPDVEVALDITMAVAAAPEARIAVYFAHNSTRGFLHALARAVHDKVNAPSIISISWASCESQWTPATRDAFQELLRDAASLGITVFVSSGDDGTNAGAFDGKVHVNYPASDPWVTACGGTTVQGRSKESSEIAWHNSGGGFSSSYAAPGWQTRTTTHPKYNGKSRRGVPDISGNAGTGYELFVYGTLTTKLLMSNQLGTSVTDNVVGPVTGTSAVAPLYAGLLASINAHLTNPVGYLNPVLYSLHEKKSTRIFNKLHRTGAISNSYQKVIENPDTGVRNRFSTPGYKARGKWNPVIGLGSINGLELLKFLQHLEHSFQSYRKKLH